jgi:hypothetical protein
VSRSNRSRNRSKTTGDRVLQDKINRQNAHDSERADSAGDGLFCSCGWITAMETCPNCKLERRAEYQDACALGYE